MNFLILIYWMPVQLGVATHEIGHALGLWHEHQRVDRGEHIDVLYENIDPAAVANFQHPPAASVTDYNLPYDVNSVMHYPSQVDRRSRGRPLYY